MNTDFARQQMVQQQVRTWDVVDRTTLAVMASVPREQFVAAGFEALAFAETALPIGHNQFMMAPNLEGRLLQALGVRRGERVLEIGTGSGFLTACLGRLAAFVTSIDIHEDFLEAAGANLKDAGVNNFELQAMDGTVELPQSGFDVIAVTGSIEVYDPRYALALNPGGRLFVVVGHAPAMEARLIERVDDNDWRTTSLFETVLAPLVNAALPRQFSF